MDHLAIQAHREILAAYKQAMEQGKLGHAHLISSADGGGCVPFALELANLILCHNLAADDPHVRLAARFEHPDLSFSFPVVAKGEKGTESNAFISEWRDQLNAGMYFTFATWNRRLNHGTQKTPVIYAAESGQISHRLSLKAFAGNAKVLMMWMPESLNPAAANKLLKLIEEPPANTYFILASHHVEDVLPTVRSRAQPLRLPSPDPLTLMNILQEQTGLDASRASLCANAAEGSLGRAIELAYGDDDQLRAFQLFRDTMRLCFSSVVEAIPDQAEKIAGLSREEVHCMMEAALRLFRACVLTNHGVDPAKSLQGEELAFVRGFAPFVTVQGIQELYAIYNEACFHVSRYGNLKIILTDVFLQTAVVIVRERKRKEAAAAV
jgi:DNA polymerase-3 subunit delta'